MKVLIGGSVGTVVGIVILIGMFGGAKASQCADASFAGAEGVADPPSMEAMEIARRVYAVGREMGVPYPKFILAAFATVIVEAGGNTTMSNPDRGDRTSVGAFQQQNFSPWTDHGRNRMNIRDAATSFYEQAIAKHESWMTIGQLAQEVQVSAYPDKYDVVVPRARYFLQRVRDEEEKGGSRGRRAGTVFESPVVGSPIKDPTSAGREKLIMPVPGVVTSPFGQRWGRLHAGIDIGAPSGTPIKAAASGVVNLRGVVSGYGNYFCIRHNPRLTTCYAHLSRYGKYSSGNGVTQGDVLGYVGCTGNCYGDHLHFETRTGPDPGSTPVDPATYLGEEIAASNRGSGTAADGECAEVTGSAAAGRARFAWPTKGGKVIGGSNQAGGSHDPNQGLGGWQSDNALDIAVPNGTDVYAADDGRISSDPSIFGDTGHSDARAGIRFTLEVSGNRLFYHHLSKLAPGIRPGKRVRRGQLLGQSGEANGVPHLHIAVEKGKPETLFGLEGKSVLVVGDSLGVGTAPYLAKLLDRPGSKTRITSDTKSGRPSTEGVTVLRRIIRREHATVVFDLGTNDGDAATLRESLKRAKRVVGPNRRLVIATVNSPFRERQKNRIIREFAERPAVDLIEWAHAPAHYLAGDGYHATPAGYQQRAYMFSERIR